MMLETVQYDAKTLFQLPPIGLLYSTYRYSTGAGTVPEKKKLEAAAGSNLQPPAVAAKQQNRLATRAALSLGMRVEVFCFNGAGLL